MVAPESWRHVVVNAPLRSVPRMLPEEVTVDRMRLEPRHEMTAGAAFWGRDAHRYRAVWTAGRWAGQGYVEVRPHSESASEVVVYLHAPKGLGRLVWSRGRLDRAAGGLAEELRAHIDALSEEREKRAAPARVRRSA